MAAAFGMGALIDQQDVVAIVLEKLSHHAEIPQRRAAESVTADAQGRSIGAVVVASRQPQSVVGAGIDALTGDLGQ